MTKHRPNYTATQNACKMCTPLGAALVFHGMERTVPLLHGSQGCATYMRRYLISHFKEPVDIASSNFSEETAVFGGAANLKQAVENVARQYRPAMIGIASTCLSETIGDDLPMILSDAARQIKGTTLVHVSTPAYTGTHMDGFHRAVAAVVDQLNPENRKQAYKPKKKKKINLFPGLLSNEDIRHLKEIFEDFATFCTILPDFSERLEGPSWQDYQAIQEGGTPIQEIEKMHVAAHSLELGAILSIIAKNRADRLRKSKGNKTKGTSPTAGTLLKERFGVPLTSMGLPMGVKATDRFLSVLSIIAGQPIPEKYKKQKGRLVDAYVDGNKYVSGKRAVIFGEEDFVAGLAGFLAEIGIIPVLCASGGKSGYLSQALEATVPAAVFPRITVQDNMGFTEMEEQVAQLPEAPDLIIGNSKGYAMARRLNLPMVRVGFPIHDRVGGPRILHIGYKGAQNLFDTIVNTLLYRRQEASTIGYAYM